MPDTRKIYVVAGSGSVDKRSVAEFNKKTADFKTRVVFEYLTEMDVDKLMVRVANLPPNSFVYYLPYTFDPHGRTVIGLDMVRRLGERTNRPVFTYLDLFALNTGIFGGRVTTTRSRAASAVDITKKVFQGEQIESINEMPQYVEFIYDWGELVKWDIDISRLPSDRTIQNRTYTFYELFKWRILAGITLLIAQAVFISILLANIRKRKLAELKLLKYRAELEDRVRDRTTELEMAKDDAENAKEEAMMASQAKSQFLANMSHELRTPMNAILGYSEIMRRDPILNSHHKEDLTTISQSGEHLLALINDVLEISKIEAKKIHIQSIVFDLRALLNDLLIMFRVQAEAKGLEIELEVHPEVSRYIFADESKLRQILINLLGNSLKFTENGKIVIRTRMQKDDPHNMRLVIAVEDTGVGIAEDELHEAFQYFEQTTSGRESKGGTGLGLAISKGYAHMMGGDITASSEVGKGSTFVVDIGFKEGESDNVQEVFDQRRIVGLAQINIFLIF